MTEVAKELDKILEKLKKDFKFHRKGMLNAKSVTSEHHYNDILEVDFKTALTAISKLLEKQDIKSREIFVPVRGAEGHYEVSNTGKVRSVLGGRRRGIELKQQTYVNRNNRGYKTVSLVKQGKVMSATVHKLVARAFISNPQNKPCINHIDGDKANNAVDNLEWSTYSENEQHSYHKLGKINPRSKTRRLNSLSQSPVNTDGEKR